MSLSEPASKLLKSILLMTALFTSSIADAQEYIGGREVKSGIENGDTFEYIDRQITLSLATGVTHAQVLPLLSQYQLTLVQDFDNLGWALAEAPAGTDIFSVINVLKQNSLIADAETNLVFRSSGFIPNDAEFYRQWSFNNTGQSPANGTLDADIDLPEAWELMQTALGTRGSRHVKIGIIDTGIPLRLNSSQQWYLSHPELNDATQFQLGTDWLSDGNSIRDQSSHGTMIAGIIAAKTNNGIGVSGIADNCTVFVNQISNGQGTQGIWFYNGMKEAVDNGAKVINVSQQARPNRPTDVDLMRAAILYARNSGVLVVCAAGNEALNNVVYPARFSVEYDNVIAVSATNYQDVLAAFSNYGSQLNLAAPGGTTLLSNYYVEPRNIYSTVPDYPITISGGTIQNYAHGAGTSFAAPMVVGVAALMLSLNPFLSSAQLRTILQQTADDKGTAGFDNLYGHGRLNAFNAVKVAGTSPQLALIGVQANHPYLTWTDSPYRNTIPYYTKNFIVSKSLNSGATWQEVATLSAATYSYIDQSEIVVNGLNPGGRLLAQYRVRATYATLPPPSSTDGEAILVASVPSTAQAIWVGIQGVGLEGNEAERKTFRLESNYPNPFNPQTTLRYEVPKTVRVKLTVSDMLGREVVTLVDKEHVAGQYEVKFNAAKLTSGIYFYRLQAGDFIETRKMMLVK